MPGLAELGIQPHPMEPKPLDADDMQRIGATLFAKIHARLKGEKCRPTRTDWPSTAWNELRSWFRATSSATAPSSMRPRSSGVQERIPTDEELAKVIVGGGETLGCSNRHSQLDYGYRQPCGVSSPRAFFFRGLQNVRDRGQDRQLHPALESGPFCA